MSCQRFTATLTTPQLNARLASGVAVPGPPGPAGPQGPTGPQGPPGSITSQSVATASRAGNVVYQNTSGVGMLVLTSWDLSSKSAQISALSDAADPPATQVAEIAATDANSGTIAQLWFPVLAGNFYACSITGGTPTLVSWVEYT